MHNGRDTHVRGIKLFSPRDYDSCDLNKLEFKDIGFTMHQSLR